MRVLIAGGGTGGHINPGIAIAKEVLKNNPDAEILFVGTTRGLEKELIPKQGFNIRFINVKGFRRKLSFDTLISVKELLKGLLQARKVIKDFKPDVVVGTGGYVCGPVLFNASLLKVPTVIHEQNAYPGVTNKILARFVDAVMISFEESRKYFASKNIYLTGNPVRHELIAADRGEARRKLKLGEEEKLIMATGGSLGAEKVNRMLVNFIKKGVPKGVRLIYSTGEKHYTDVLDALKEVKIDHEQVHIVPYIHNMHEVMPAADLIINRAGAITLSEITALGVPSILIPSPHVTNNHQEHNARALEKFGAAKVLLEKELDNINFGEYINKFLSDEQKLREMAENSKKIGKRDAVEKIYEIIEKHIKRA